MRAKPSRRRGAALLTVLLVSFLMLVVCLSLATMCVLNLNLSSSYVTSSQELLIAQAAVAQFQKESDDWYDTGYLQGGGPPNWKERFRRPVLEAHEGRFPGRAWLDFDPGKPYFSLDNSASTKPAAGWLDRGRGTKSIPAHAVDLWIRVELGSTTTVWHAMLRRRWPYALTSGGLVRLMGTPPRGDFPGGSVQEALAPSWVLGDIYSFGGHSTLIEGEEGPNRRVVPVSHEMADVLDFARPRDNVQVRMVVGLNMLARRGERDDWYRVKSRGNVFKGNLDVMQSMSEQSAIRVAAGNIQAGLVRAPVNPSRMLRSLQRALRLPRVDDGIEIVSAGGTQWWDRYFRVLKPDEHYHFDNSTNTRDFFYLKRSLTLPPPELGASPAGDGGFEYAPDRQFILRGSAGNRYYVARVGRNGVESKSNSAGLTLQNCLLFVDGNLDLSSTTDVDGKFIPSNLVGINATLVVNGNLILAGANIDAQERGMVIYAKRLVGQCRGHFRGLIMVQRSLALLPPELPAEGAAEESVQRLTITGGIIAGGQSTRIVIGDNPDWRTKPGEEIHNPPDRLIWGLNLWSTTLEYDPQYLSTVHKYGPLALLSLRRVK